jgi:hypothetical protein
MQAGTSRKFGMVARPYCQHEAALLRRNERKALCNLFREVEGGPSIPILGGCRVAACYEQMNHGSRSVRFDSCHVQRCTYKRDRCIHT